MNIAVDPNNGMPRWEASQMKYGPKEDFAYEAAVRLMSGKTTVDDLRNQIVAAANLAWKRRGGKDELFTLNDVKAALGGSAKEWFHEIQKVAHSPEALSKLVKQKGKGLTALSRLVDSLQPQRAKGFASSKPSQAFKPLLDTLGSLRSVVDTCGDLDLTRAVGAEILADTKKYAAFLRRVRAND